MSTDYIRGAGSLRAPLHTSLLLKCSALYGILPSGGIPNMEGEPYERRGIESKVAGTVASEGYAGI